jgi:hypothetical protein
MSAKMRVSNEVVHEGMENAFVGESLTEPPVRKARQRLM